MGESSADSLTDSISKPTVSVLLPVYQAERTIEEAVESILAQSFDDFELLALDDGSTDSSVRILESLAARDDRISVLPHSHVGLVRRLNAGIRLARGAFIARMDADDVCYPQRLEKQLAYLVAHPDCVAVGTGAVLVDAERLRIRQLEQAKDHEEIESRFIHGDGGALLHASAVYRVDALRKIGGYTEKLDGGEDLDLHLRLGEIGRLANLEDCLFEYRQSLEGVCGAHRLQVRRNQDAAIRSALRRRGLDPADAPARCYNEPIPAPGVIWAKWAGWALAAGYPATARKYAMLSFRAAPRRHGKLLIRAWLGIQPHFWQRLRGALGMQFSLARASTLPGTQPPARAQVQLQPTAPVLRPAELPAPSNEDEPAVTVLLAFRNREAFLRDAIDSILDQTFTDFEFVIVDDASTDSSAEILEQCDDLRIRLVSNRKPIGMARSLNRGIALARGRYIARMEPDGLSLPGRLHQQIALLEADADCAMVATHAEAIDVLGLQSGIIETPNDDAIARTLLQENCVVDGSAMFRRRVLDDVGLYDENLDVAMGASIVDLEDYDLWLRMSQEHRIRVIPEPLYCSRQREPHGDGVEIDSHERCGERLRERTRQARLLRALGDLDEDRLTLEQATERISRFGRQDEIAQLERHSDSGVIGPLLNRLRRSSSFERWISMPRFRRHVRSILAEHRRQNPDSNQTIARLRAVVR